MIGISWCIDTRTNPYLAMRRRYHKMIRERQMQNQGNNVIYKPGGKDKDVEDGMTEETQVISEQIELFAYTEGENSFFWIKYNFFVMGYLYFWQFPLLLFFVHITLKIRDLNCRG